MLGNCALIEPRCLSATMSEGVQSLILKARASGPNSVNIGTAIAPTLNGAEKRSIKRLPWLQDYGNPFSAFDAGFF